MVKFTSLAVAAGFATFAMARNCTPNLNYCGTTLLDIGNYYAQINNALSDAGQPTNSAHVQQSLFQCTGGSNGEIRYLQYCSGGCQDAGQGQSDTC